jgi:hypothetical protein
MNIRIHFCCWAVVPLLWSADVNAQARQTVEGAQKFLQSQAEGGGIAGIYPFFGVDGVVSCNRSGWGDGQCVYGRESGILRWNLKSLDTVDESGRENSCVTRMAVIADSPDSHLRNGRGYNYPIHDGYVTTHSLDGYNAPRYIRWGKVSVTREINNSLDVPKTVVMARYRPSPGAKDEVLGFQYQDSSMADRVEYAMKFLQASCDESASTGF